MLSVEDVLHILSLPLIGVVPDTEEIVSSTNLGEPIVHNEKSLAGEAFRRIAKRIEGEEIPLLDLESNKGFFAKLKGIFK
jgi:septum site-determining protein MinD